MDSEDDRGGSYGGYGNLFCNFFLLFFLLLFRRGREAREFGIRSMILITVIVYFISLLIILVLFWLYVGVSCKCSLVWLSDRFYPIIFYQSLFGAIKAISFLRIIDHDREKVSTCLIAHYRPRI